MRRALLVLSMAWLTAPGLPAQTTTAAAGRATAHRGATKHGRVDINSATDRELERLPGVDAKTAQKIVEGRPYSTISDLSHAGLTPAQIKKLAPHVLIGSPATPVKKNR